MPGEAFGSARVEDPLGTRTPRRSEVDVARLMYRGLRFKQMPAQLGCTYPTVDTHRRRPCEKAGERRRDQVLLTIQLVGMMLVVPRER